MAEDPILFSIAELYHMQFIVLVMEELERHNPDKEECNRVTGVTVVKTNGCEFFKTNGYDIPRVYIG